MPRKTNRRKSKKRKSRKKPFPLGLYLVIGFLCAGIIWLISIRPGEETPDVQEVAVEEVSDPGQAIDAAARKLGIPQLQKAESQEQKSKLKYDLPIDRGKMDLTFANAIVKTELEKRGAKLTSGKAANSKQVLTFKSGKKEMEVNLYYDKTPAKAARSNKFVAIVVDDFGSIKGDLLQEFLDLPREITFAIFPGMDNSVSTMERARSQGRETLIHIPMEPLDYPAVNPGKDPILVQMGQAEVERTLNRALNELPHSLGINNHMGSLATTDAVVMGHVMEVLKKKGKVFLDSRTSNVSVAYQTAQKMHVPAYRNDIFLDSPDISDATLNRKLEQIRTMSAARNNIIAITHCHSGEKLAYLRTFIQKLKAEGYTLIPLSQVGKYDVPLIM